MPPQSAASAAWDADGDGEYDDGTGATAAVSTAAGTHTVGLRVTDSAGRSAVVRKTFTLAAAPTRSCRRPGSR